MSFIVMFFFSVLGFVAVFDSVLFGVVVVVGFFKGFLSSLMPIFKRIF